MKKACLECNESIKGRMDKKFCCDTCRNTFNNKLKTPTSNYYRTVNSALRKNHGILATLLPKKTIKVSRHKLLERGFNFAFFTSMLTTRKGECYFFCYDYGYLPLPKDLCLIVKKEIIEN
ncbi:MAG TPA: hypothetical protein VGC65_05500 [Bacteroidia bacterium]|jgi:transposase-like protein